MKNLAGRKDCDIYVKREIEQAGLEPNQFSFSTGGEVDSHYRPSFQGWRFTRAWYYWVAHTDSTPLLFKYADELHETHGNVVRVDGHCLCPAPKEWFKQPWHIGVNHYHIDSQEGLNYFIKMVKRQTKERK